MKLCSNISYNHKDIKYLLKSCFICNQTDSISISCTVYNNVLDFNLQEVHCSRCAMTLSFSFKYIDRDSELVEGYNLNYLKIANLEYRSAQGQLKLYINNTHANDIDTNMVDLSKCQVLAILG